MTYDNNNNSSSNSSTSFDHIPPEVICEYILPFIGNHQYRFIASINRFFYNNYLVLYSDKTTTYDVATIVRYLIEECDANLHVTDNDGDRLLHCASAGNQLHVVQYLVEHCQVDMTGQKS